MLTDAEIISVAEGVLRPALGSAGFDRSYVIAGMDQDGEPTISVVARFKPGAEAPDGKAIVSAIAALRRGLLERGEDRPSVLRYEFPDDDVPALEPGDFASSQR